MSIISKETLVEKMKQYPTLLQQVMIMLDALGECLTTVNQYESDTKQAISDSKEAKENSATALTNSIEAKTSANDAVKKVNDITYDIKELMSNNDDNDATPNFSLDISKVNKDDVIMLGDITRNYNLIEGTSRLFGSKDEYKITSSQTYFKHIYNEDTEVNNFVAKGKEGDIGDIFYLGDENISTAGVKPNLNITLTNVSGLSMSFDIAWCIGFKLYNNSFIVLTGSHIGTPNVYMTKENSDITVSTIADDSYFTPVWISAYDNGV